MRETQQPAWRLLWATDDQAVYEDATGIYSPEMTVAQWCDDTRTAFVYRFALDRCWQAMREDGSTFLTDMDPTRKDLPYPLTSYRPWFVDDLGAIAESCGDNLASLVSRLCSDDPGDLASAYSDIGGYHGFDNFDGYPREWSEHEFNAWPDRGSNDDDSNESED